MALAAASLAMRYLWGPGEDQILVSEWPDETQLLWHLPDHLGSTRDLIDNAGNDSHITYDTFGNATTTLNVTLTRYYFTAQEYDADQDAYLFNVRWYDSAVGVFLTPDPIGFNGGSWNITSYVGNSPTNYTDPSGREEENVYDPLMERLYRFDQEQYRAEQQEYDAWLNKQPQGSTKLGFPDFLDAKARAKEQRRADYEAQLAKDRTGFEALLAQYEYELILERFLQENTKRQGDLPGDRSFADIDRRTSLGFSRSTMMCHGIFNGDEDAYRSWKETGRLPDHLQFSGSNLSWGDVAEIAWQSTIDSAPLFLETAGELFGTIAGIFLEPVDMIMTGVEIAKEPDNPWSYAGLAPFVPAAVSKAGKHVDDALDVGNSLNRLDICPDGVPGARNYFPDVPGSGPPVTPPVIPKRVPSPDAQNIGNGHAWGKHQNEFPEFNTPDEFAKHIDDIMQNPASPHKKLDRGREAWWDDKSKTAVIKDPKNPDGGTAFRPKNGKSYFDNELR